MTDRANRCLERKYMMALDPDRDGLYNDEIESGLQFRTRKIYFLVSDDCCSCTTKKLFSLEILASVLNCGAYNVSSRFMLNVI